jgi:hypothetical protein
MIYSAMNPQIAIELLDRAWQMIIQNQISFSYNYIDKPKGKQISPQRIASDQQAAVEDTQTNPSIAPEPHLLKRVAGTFSKCYQTRSSCHMMGK